jgi:two-component system nitrogen regulation sensor histidine kinase NtrY
MSSPLTRWTRSLPRWALIAVPVCFLLLLGIHLWSVALRSSREQEWDHVSVEADRNALERAAQLFDAAQSGMQTAGASIASNELVVKALAGGMSSRIPLFTFLEHEHERTGLDFEVYNRDRELIAWHGDAGKTSREALTVARTSHSASVIDRTPMSSRLVVGSALFDGSGLTGWVVVSRLVSIDVPLQSALLRQQTLSDDIDRGVNAAVRFAFGGPTQGGGDGRATSAPLLDLEGKVFGSISVERLSRAEVIAPMMRRFQIAERLVLLLILGIMARLVLALPAVRRSRIVGLVISIALLWTARYLLVWFELPVSLADGGLFQPGAYASPFGGGLARSPGDLLLTALALVGSCLLCVRAVLPAIRVSRGLQWHPAVRLVSAALATAVVFWALRGFAAGVRSGVFDSSLSYLDVRSVLPGVDQGVMVTAFLLIGLSLLMVSVVASRWVIGLLTPAGSPESAGLMRTIALSLFAAVIFSRFTGSPLLSLPYQLTYALALPMLARWVFVRDDPGFRHAIVLLAISGLLTYPLLDQFGQEKDRLHVEVLAIEQLQPVDGWLHHVVDEGLDGLDTDENRARLSEGFGADVSGIAFRRWATSLACSQGYDALFVVDDPMGNEASRFAIGSSVGIMSEVLQEIAHTGRDTVIVRDVGRGVNAVKVYAGSRSLRAPDGLLLGVGRVVIAAGRQSFFRGETPGLLRGDSGPRTDSFYRQIFFSEYLDGALLTSTNPAIPVNHQLADPVAAELMDSTRASLWFDEVVAEGSYETFYVPRPGNRTDVVAVTMRSLDASWSVVGLMKTGVVVLVLSFIMLTARRIMMVRRRGMPRRTFRVRLLTAMLVTALIPLTFVVVSVEIADRERAAEAVRRLLEGEMQKVLYAITEHPQPGVTILNLPPGPAAVEDLASDIETDFNVYTDRDLRASSRQILYDAGFLDGRLDGSVYARIVLGGERFVMQDEYLGSVKYTAGYRPILDARGDIIGVVSVPTLFQPQEDEQQAARRMAFVFGAYVSILIAVVLLAALFSGRIAAPLQRLTAATRRVASGDLDVVLPAGRMEGEIGELTTAFDQMVRDLRTMRGEQARIERELAWKEMAQQIAHEIKNPLTPMRLSIQHLRRIWNDRVADVGPVLESVTATVLEQIDALSRIASEFSHFARMPRRNLVELDVASVVNEAVQLFAQEERIIFEVQRENELPRITADQEELRRAFINVIRNAIQATDGPGRIAITLQRTGKHVEVRFTDFGRGIPEAIRERVFEPRFSTKTDGMGLGLAIVKKSIDDMGGNVTLKSVEGEGTVVTFRLPVPAGDGGPDA